MKQDFNSGVHLDDGERRARFKLFSAVPNPPSEIRDFDVRDIQRGHREHLKSNATRNRRILGDAAYERLIQKPAKAKS